MSTLGSQMQAVGQRLELALWGMEVERVLALG